MTARVSRSEIALRFGAVTVCVALLAGGLARVLMQQIPPAAFHAASFPPMFAISTVALWLGSACLSRAVADVRRERQREFRRDLIAALLAGTVFVACQVSALNWLIQRQRPEEVATGAAAFVAVFAALHAMHFIVAVLFLIFVTVWAFADRYDHEYFWGVSLCAWFWHILGLAWLAVLAVVAIAR